MKTNGVFIKIVSGILLVTTLNALAISQKTGTAVDTQEFPAHYFNNAREIKDWMINDLEFVTRPEKVTIEDWMISLGNELDLWRLEEPYNLSWIFDTSVLPAVYLNEWMLDCSSRAGKGVYEVQEVIELQYWMLHDTRLGTNMDIEPIDIRDWMLDSNGAGRKVANDVDIRKWMLDVEFWNKSNSCSTWKLNI